MRRPTKRPDPNPRLIKPAEYDVLIEMLAAARDEHRARGATTEGPGWQRALDSGMLELIREGNLAEAKERLQACLSSSSG